MGEYYVYGHINPITNKFFYIGKGKGRRCSSRTGRTKFWTKTVEKYGYAIIKFVDGITNEQACEIEKQYIQKYRLRGEGGCLVNLTYGGDGGTLGMKLSDETRARMSASKTGIKPSEESKIKGSLAKMGIKNPNYGKRTWNFGKPRTEEEKRKIGASRIGIELSAERKEKSLLALQKAQLSRINKMLKVRCLKTGIIWINRRECIGNLKISLSKFKDMIRKDRCNQRLEYIIN